MSLARRLHRRDPHEVGVGTFSTAASLYYHFGITPRGSPRRMGRGRTTMACVEPLERGAPLSGRSNLRRISLLRWHGCGASLPGRVQGVEVVVDPLRLSKEVRGNVVTSSENSDPLMQAEVYHPLLHD